MQKTKGTKFTLDKYFVGHNLDTAQEVPPFEVGKQMKLLNDSGFEEMVAVPAKPSHERLWLNLARNYGMSKLDEFGGTHAKYQVTWPDGSKNWVTVDAGGWEKVW